MIQMMSLYWQKEQKGMGGIFSKGLNSIFFDEIIDNNGDQCFSERAQQYFLNEID
ncbi:hypothetical protein AXF42_Ash018247 [Apostasia shenzhenica]|uniref:Uncharacterized protein n=1 Tax=Apostasia shenzhenica TaxID=1088818 RepID=A0A2I0B2L0_9ASPA|nr:hypothetical protein AXF42_Ash018247 [Apostasia shenzhenica]